VFVGLHKLGRRSSNNHWHDDGEGYLEKKKNIRASLKGNTGRKLWKPYSIITTCTTV
jgi:hypothetical protein